MVCVCVGEDNRRDLASRLSSVHTQNHTTTCLLHQHAFAFDVKHWNVNERCNIFLICHENIFVVPIASAKCTLMGKHETLVDTYRIFAKGSFKAT